MRSLGWVMFAGTCLLSGVQVALLVSSGDPLFSYDVIVENAFPIATIGAIAGAAVGAVIVSRYPRNVIGWLFCGGQLGSALSQAAAAYVSTTPIGDLEPGGEQFLAESIRLIAQTFNAYYTMAFISLIFLLVPDGRLPSRRWRLAPFVPVAAVVMQVGVYLSLPSAAFEPGAQIEFNVAQVFFAVSAAAALALGIALGAIAIWLRLRRAEGVLRQQLLWLAAAAAAVTGTYLLAFVAQLLLTQAPWYLIIPWYLSYVFVSVAVGVAIMKYRLYDIDVILSRAIVLGVLAVFVTVGYIGVVVAIGSAVTALGSSGSTVYWPSLVATALVAAAFQPVRRHVLRLADQFVYGNRAAPYEALASLSRRLADSPSPEDLPARVAEATGRAIGASRIVVELGAPGSGLLTAVWPSGAQRDSVGPTAGLELPVLDVGEQVGTITVLLPPGRDLRPFERELLDDVAAQAGVAFRNALLEAELAARVEQTEIQSAELAASRQRLVGVEDEARERLAGSISREVIPHLAVVESALDRRGAQGNLDDRVPVPPAGLLDRLIAQTELALENLRTVCRGVFPALLERRGMVPALSAQLDATRSPAQLEVAESAERRLDRAAEAAGYLFCVEVAPPDRPSVIALAVDDGTLTVTVSGESVWDDPTGGDWQHARDRVAALGGEVRVERDGDGSQRVRAMIPLADQLTVGEVKVGEVKVGEVTGDEVMTAQTASSRSGPKADLGT